jgi:zinc carboxypeptidase
MKSRVSKMTRRGLAATIAATVATIALVAPGGAAGAVDPEGCTAEVSYDPSVPTFAQYAAEKGLTNNTLGGFATGTANRHLSAELYGYEEAIAAATASNPRVRVAVKSMGSTVEGRPFQYSVIATPSHMAHLEADAGFWRGVRAGTISESSALGTLGAADPPAAFGWITETPHGNEPAGGEASMRMLYELAARTDCANARRLQTMDFFIDPARNPDGRDNNTRTTAWAFDPNRDLMYQTQDVNSEPLDIIDEYPSLFFIDAHQQSSGYFFPPNEDPVHHEISHFSLDEIQKVIGPALQSRFNDQSLQYRNYNDYDLFTPEYGDSVPSLILGAAGMTYEKGSSEIYGKQVYDHYLAMDETANVVSKEEPALAEGWVKQWTEAAAQGSDCELQPNELVSPLHETIEQQPDISICGYYFKPGKHSGDTAHVLKLLQGRGVHVYQLTSAVTVSGAHDWGTGEGRSATRTETLPAGTLWIPTSQTMKHWIDATLEEDPYIPYPYYYDVVDWAFSQLGDLAGNGQLQAALPAETAMTEVAEPSLGGVEEAGSPVYAFPTDSTEALGLVTELLAEGATIYRGATAFNWGGTKFPTGTAMVAASSLSANSIDLEAKAKGRETPVLGLTSFPPIERFKMKKPKIAVYTGTTTVPTNPLYPGTGSGHCTSSSFCEMLFTLAEQDNIPLSLLTPVTTTEISEGVLTSGGYTALISLNSALATTGTPTPPATALQTFVNEGGVYVGYGANAATSIRNAGISKLNVSATTTWNAHCPDSTNPAEAGSLRTPGTTFSATFTTSDPIAWGFDEGGYIYRDSSSSSTDPVFDPATLTGEGATLNATAVVSYGEHAYGYQCNALGEGHLPTRPYVVDQPFGAGHAIVIGSDPFFRAWNTGAQRLVLNGVLYPSEAAVTGSFARVALARKTTASTAAAPVVADPLPKKALPAVKSRPVKVTHDPLEDVLITVKARKLGTLRKVVAAAKLPARVRRHVKWEKGPGRGQASLRIVGASAFSRHEPGDPSTKGTQLWIYNDLELRPTWAWRVIHGLVAKNLRTYTHRI